MKTIALSILLCFFWISTTAQAPHAFKYQAVARNSSGVVLADQSISFKISILSGSASGTVVYSETHTGKKTNAFGLVDMEIGKGVASTGTFSSISWGSNTFFVKVEMDPAGGTTYQLMGTSQLLSVPFALHAKTVESVSTDATLAGNGSTSPLKIAPQGASSGQVLKWDGTTWKPAGDEVAGGTGSNPVGPAGGDLSGNYPDPLIGAEKVTSAKILDGTIATADLADNLVTSDKIQDGTVVTTDLANSAVSSDKLANNAVIPSKLAPMGASNGQILKWNGTTWAPANDETGGGGLTLPYAGSGTPPTTTSLFEITDLRTTGGGATSSGLRGISKSVDGIGVEGQADATSGHATGILGTTNSSSGAGLQGQGPAYGIKGLATGTSITKTYGVYGDASATEGCGVYGTSGYTGVKGVVTGSTGANFGVFGETQSSGGYGIYGHAGASSGANFGVYGKTLSSEGCGVKGWATSTSGTNFGIYGQTSSGNGYGIYGLATSTTGSNFGVYGESASYNGTGIKGVASSNSGMGIGVNGETNAETGIGVKGYALNSTGGTGVVGISSCTTGRGVFGAVYKNSGENYGVYGLSESASGCGVYGTSQKYGVYATAIGTQGRGVVGEATNTASIGVQGIATNTSSTGVWGEGANQGVYGTSSNDTGKGVFGQVSSGNGYSGYFDGGKFYVNSNVGIKTNAPTQALDVNGGARIRSIGTGAYSKPVNITSDGTLTTSTSDSRLKENVQTLQNPLDMVMRLRGVSFTWKNNPEYGRRIGFIAQEFEQVIPELVFNNEADGYKGINYAEVSAVLVEAIKELKAENDRLKTENEQVISRIEKLEKLMETSSMK